MCVWEQTSVRARERASKHANGQVRIRPLLDSVLHSFSCIFFMLLMMLLAATCALCYYQQHCFCVICCCRCRGCSPLIFIHFDFSNSFVAYYILQSFTFLASSLDYKYIHVLACIYMHVWREKSSLRSPLLFPFEYSNMCEQSIHMVIMLKLFERHCSLLKSAKCFGFSMKM